MSTNAIASTQTKQLSPDKVFGYLVKSDVTRICIKRATYEGHTFLDFREEYKEDGVWKYSRKGFTLGNEEEPVKEFKELLEAILADLENGS